jgi:hypothetical protein
MSIEERPEPTSTTDLFPEQERNLGRCLAVAAIWLVFALIAIPLLAASLRLGIFILQIGR